MSDKKANVGGQAVIEGVMMRSPDYVTVAVRKPEGGIVLKKDAYKSFTKRIKALGLPFIRGGVTLIESMVLGIKALNFSSDVAMQDVEEDDKSKPKKPHSETAMKWLTTGTLVLAFGLGFLFFFYLPLVLTEWIGFESGLMFNLVDGGFRLVLFLGYLILVSRWKEIRRVFEYHGAEHKSIFAFENNQPLTLEGVKDFTTYHPRCGTSFLLIVMIVSLLVFICLGKPETVGDRLIRFLFIPVIGGISYEIIRLAGSKWGKKFAQVLVAPGLWLQRITTKEPDDSQLEVALVALKAALDLDVGDNVEMAE